ncbi:MAG: hypothetical protein ABSC50_04665 [Candidatus Bathyarchaeia archaeon]
MVNENGKGRLSFRPILLSCLLVATVLLTVGVTYPVPVRACSNCNFLLKWGSSGSGNGQFNEPYGLAVDSAGNVYVTDIGNDRVEKFTSTGAFLNWWGSLGSGNGQFSSPKGVAVDSAGNVYVTDVDNDRVEEFAGTGTFITKWGSGPSPGNGQFNHPGGVAVDSAGNVYVADRFNNRVELFGDLTLATIGLFAGWNLVSLPVIPVNTAIAKVLQDLIATHNFTIVWSYQGGVWKSFMPPSTGTLKTMADGLGVLDLRHPAEQVACSRVCYSARVDSAHVPTYVGMEPGWLQAYG